MNPDLKDHILAQLDKVCFEIENIFSDDFFEKQIVVTNAQDNVDVRRYIDSR